jgi:hypothetical protein
VIGVCASNRIAKSKLSFRKGNIHLDGASGEFDRRPIVTFTMGKLVKKLRKRISQNGVFLGSLVFLDLRPFPRVTKMLIALKYSM